MKIKNAIWIVSLLSSMTIGSAQTLSPILIDKWPGEGDATDSVSTNNGTMSNVTFAPGQVGQAFVFDGSGSVDFGDVAGSLGTGDFTLDFWIQTVVSEQNLISYQSPDIATGMFSCQVANGQVVFAMADAQYSGSVQSRARVDDGSIHHVAVERRSVDLRVYIDGVLSAISTASGTVTLSGTSVVFEPGGVTSDDDGNSVTNDPMNITNVATLVVGSGFVGMVDEIELYNGALSSSEIYLIAHPDTTLAILEQPISLHALEGRSVVFAVTAVGTGQLLYQWRFNGMDIPGATDETLPIDCPQLCDVGTYAVVVSNPTGSLTSSDATLMVTIANANSPSPFVRWSAEGDASDTFGIYNGTMQNITFAPGVLGYAFKFDGNSSINFGNRVGNFGTNDFSVDFWMQTKFTGYQEAVIGKRQVCTGGTMWEFRLSVPRNFLGFCALQGFTSTVSSLSSLSPVRMTDGVFHHVAETRKDNIYKMYIDGRLVSTSVASERINLQNYVDFVMGMNPCDGVDGTVHYNGLLDEVEMFNRALSDSEVYTLYQPDPSLTVVNPPSNRAIIEGNSVTLSASATGLGPICFQWQLNGSDISGATSSSYTINPVQMTDAGIYRVVVHNTSETATSSGATLTVIPADSVLPGLVNKWSAEGNGDDLMGNSSMASLNVHFSAGAIGQGFHFDGLDEYIVFDKTTGNFGTNDFTLDFWFRNKGGVGWNQLLVGKRGIYETFIGTDGLLRFNINDNASHTCGLIYSNSVVDGVFHHAAIVRESTNLSLYVDGVPVTSADGSALGDVSNNLYLYMGWMGSGNYGHCMKDQLDEVEIYNRALTADEIAGLYNQAASAPLVDGQLPQLISAYLGDSITLHAPAVTGQGPMTYQWQLNGVDISGATDSDFNVAGLDSNGAGVYTVVITSPYGSISSPVASISIQLSPGSYNGLFYLPTAPTDDDSGFVTLTLTSKQTYSGQIKQAGLAYPFTGSFSANRTSVVTVPRKNKKPLSISLCASMENNQNKIKGAVRDGSRTVPLQACRAVFGDNKPTPQAGNYTLVLPCGRSATAPNGTGFGNVTIKPNGSISLVANLADDTVTSQGIYVASSGVWPMYISLYGGRGSVLGWLSFTNSTETRCAGNLRWIKSSKAGGKNYPAGFASKISVMGSSFANPTNGLGIVLTNASMVLQSVKLAPLTDKIVKTNKNVITFSQTGTNRNLTVTPGSGRFAGSFSDPVTGKLAPIKGIVLQNQSFAEGYFISTNLSGHVKLRAN